MKVASMYIAIDAACLYTGNKSPSVVATKILRYNKPYRFPLPNTIKNLEANFFSGFGWIICFIFKGMHFKIKVFSCSGDLVGHAV